MENFIWRAQEPAVDQGLECSQVSGKTWSQVPKVNRTPYFSSLYASSFFSLKTCRLHSSGLVAKNNTATHLWVCISAETDSAFSSRESNWLTWARYQLQIQSTKAKDTESCSLSLAARSLFLWEKGASVPVCTGTTVTCWLLISSLTCFCANFGIKCFWLLLYL